MKLSHQLGQGLAPTMADGSFYHNDEPTITYTDLMNSNVPNRKHDAISL